MKVYLVVDVGSGNVGRVMSTESKAVEMAKVLANQGVWKRIWEVQEVDMDGPKNTRHVFSTVDDE